MRDFIFYGIMNVIYFEMLDEVVFINKFVDMICYIKELEIKYGIRVLNFGYFGDGNIYIIMMKDVFLDDVW